MTEKIKKVWTILYIEDDKETRDTIVGILSDKIKNAFVIGVSDIDKAIELLFDESKEKLKAEILSQYKKVEIYGSIDETEYKTDIEENKEIIDVGCIILDMCNDEGKNTGIDFIRNFRPKNKIPQIIVYSGELGNKIFDENLIENDIKDVFGVRKNIDDVKKTNPALAAQMALQFYYDVLIVLKKSSSKNQSKEIFEPELEMAVWSAYKLYDLMCKIENANKVLRKTSNQFINNRLTSE